MNIGIAFSGGGARGVAHLGMLKAIEQFGIRPVMVTGTSAGAIVGAFYAYGYPPDEILEIIIKTRLLRILRLSFTGKGLLTLEKTENFFRAFLPTDSFEALQLPLYVCATDVASGKPAFFSRGELVKPVIASSAIPVIFTPVLIGEQLYMDGGIVNNLPVEPLIGHCDKIIGLHCNPVEENYRAAGMRNLLERTFILTINTNVAQRKNHCDLFLEPYELSRYSAMDFSRVKDIFDAGYHFALSEEIRIRALAGPATTKGAGRLNEKPGSG